MKNIINIDTFFYDPAKHKLEQEKQKKDEAAAAIKKMGKKNGRLCRDLRTSYQERGDTEALEKAHALLEDQQNLTLGDRERLFGFLDGGGKVILLADWD